ncbi:DUF4190 domain-containing protein [Krasilnikovia sp. M28-CT-15]|uniref:DUF4190 domain-containing protein n=1 Tax=Krasilnikovia sp. M28-CT-15 TaxID=3373540 RepID=UPI00387745D8
MTYELPHDLERTRYAYPVPVVPGAPPAPPGLDGGPVISGAVAQGSSTSGAATAAMVLGVLGALGGWFLLGLPCLAAIVLGHQGMSATRDGMRGGHPMAVTGLVLGYLFVVPWSMVFPLGGVGAVLNAFGR